MNKQQSHFRFPWFLGFMLLRSVMRGGYYRRARPMPKPKLRHLSDKQIERTNRVRRRRVRFNHARYQRNQTRIEAWLRDSFFGWLICAVFTLAVIAGVCWLLVYIVGQVL